MTELLRTGAETFFAAPSSGGLLLRPTLSDSLTRFSKEIFIQTEAFMSFDLGDYMVIVLVLAAALGIFFLSRSSRTSENRADSGQRRAGKP